MRTALSGHNVDVITAKELRDLAERQGPWATLTVPTAPHGPDTVHNVRLFREQLDAIDIDLTSWCTPEDAEAMLRPLYALCDDRDFWQQQGQTLIAWCAPGYHRVIRSQVPAPARAVVGDRVAMSQIVPHLEDGSEYLVLRLAQDQVKLYAASRSVITEVDPGPLPEDMADALPATSKEPELQNFAVKARSSVRPTGKEMFHGHGQGDEVTNMYIDRFMLRVAQALRQHLDPNETRPLVVACPAHYLPIFRKHSTYLHIVERAVEGSPTELSDTALHEETWSVVIGELEQRETEFWNNHLHKSGTGLLIEDPQEVVTAAQEGRVAVLGICPETITAERAEGVTGNNNVDLAIAHTLATDGRVCAMPKPSPELRAVLRY